MTGGHYQNQLYKEYEALLELNERLAAQLKKQTQQANAFLKQLKINDGIISELNEVIAKQKAEKETLEKEVLRLRGALNLDSTNSGLPSSRTPLHKNKPIPNSRKKTGKKKGGQIGHKKVTLSKFPDDEINQIQEHRLEACPHCHGALQETGETKTKDETDYQVIVIRKRHFFPQYVCQDCRKKVHVPIPKQLKEENQYGPHVQSLALSLMNEANVSLNKTRKMITGMTLSLLQPSEGYLAKLQKRAAAALQGFVDEIRGELLQQPLIYWDDTVVAIHKTRGCLRFYGTEKWAWYRAHPKKDLAGMKEDAFLTYLSPETTVMHDHNRVNYNEVFSYQNIECNVHLLRDLRKCTENTGHTWSAQLEQLITEQNTQRSRLIEEGKDGFSDLEALAFFDQLDTLIVCGVEENSESPSLYYEQEERRLLNRLTQYRNYYFAWVLDIDLPFSNNLSERSLRGVKSKMKVAGQFQSTEAAQWYATIRSYVESCYRHGINSIEALDRLMTGNPYTVQELKKI